MNDEIREAVRQWRAKAHSDQTAIEILTSSEQCPADAVCFHCQQFVEKLLKATLTKNGIEAPKTHDLRQIGPSEMNHAVELSKQFGDILLPKL